MHFITFTYLPGETQLGPQEVEFDKRGGESNSQTHLFFYFARGRVK
jgi:hypothetical protein